MQDNEPLMRSLSKLVNLNNPDLVLFVGEALVGNDSIDQVRSYILFIGIKYAVRSYA
jgi:signal recognition particle receptor subunit alpha